jgi:predicted methyltransferase
VKHPTQRRPPDIVLSEGPEGAVTLYIDGAQAMQAWERQLMERSAEILCEYGSEFIEAGLGLGFSALTIARRPTTTRHVVVEPYQQVVDLFNERHLAPPTLEIVTADFFEYVETLPRESFDGIFFDPALPAAMWTDQPFWDRVIPHMLRILRHGGALVPFFTTEPQLRKRFATRFDRILIERRPYVAYPTTGYMTGIRGSAYLQCYVKE